MFIGKITRSSTKAGQSTLLLLVPSLTLFSMFVLIYVPFDLKFILLFIL